MNWQSIYPDLNICEESGIIQSFGETRSDYSALLTKNILIPNTRGYIELSGPDNRKFLQGQVTCDIENIAEGEVIPGAHCTPKGRIVFLFTASGRQDDTIVLNVHPSVTQMALASLKKYAVFFKTEITDISSHYNTALVSGPDDESILAPLLSKPLPETHHFVEDSDINLRKISANLFQVKVNTQISEQPLPKLAKDLTPVGEPIGDLLFVHQGTSEVVTETIEMFIPQMLNLDTLGFINFKKGCYTGQEVVARAHYRGAVKRRLYHLITELYQLPSPGTAIKNDQGKAVGNIASAAWANENQVEILAVLAKSPVEGEQLQFGEQIPSAVEQKTLPYDISENP